MINKIYKNEKRIRRVNCYQCGVEIVMGNEVSLGKVDQTDKIILCKKHDRIKKYGKKKLIKRV